MCLIASDALSCSQSFTLARCHVGEISSFRIFKLAKFHVDKCHVGKVQRYRISQLANCHEISVGYEHLF
jgi:hypothetical protein